MLAAIISAIATIAAAVIAFVGNERRRQTLELLAKSDAKRSLSISELEDIKLQASAFEQIGGQSPSGMSVGPAKVKTIYPGSATYRNISEFRETTRYDYSNIIKYSPINISMDGEALGTGSGEEGFNFTFDAPIGRHTLLFRWTGTRNHGKSANVSDASDRDETEDLSGRKETVFWVLRGGNCTLHLDGRFNIDHIEPNIIIPSCVSCRMPGVRRCRCGRKYCAEHAAILSDQEVCFACKEEAIEKQLKYAVRIAIGIAIVAALAAFKSYMS